MQGGRGRGGKPLRSHRYSNQTQASTNNNVTNKTLSQPGSDFVVSQQSQDGSSGTQLSQGPLTQGMSMSMSMSQPFGMSQPGLSQVDFSQV